MRKIELKIVTREDLLQDAIDEAKILFKEHGEKIKEKHVGAFLYNKPTLCFYGQVFGQSFNDDSVEFKNKHNFKAYREGKAVYLQSEDTEWVMQDNHTDKTQTALEIVSSELPELGQAINISGRLNFVVEPQKIIDLKIF